MTGPQIEQCFFQNSSITDNHGTRAVFSLLVQPSSVANMLCVTEMGLPALTPVVAQLEAQFENDPEFPLSNHTNRQNVGRMVKFIMQTFGYEIKRSGLNDRVRLREFSKARLFKTAAIYEKTTMSPSSQLIMFIK